MHPGVLTPDPPSGRGATAEGPQGVFAALSDPVRRTILEGLRSGPETAGSIAGWFDISRPAISRHLRILREAGLVRSESHGRHHVYELDATPVAMVTEWVAGLRNPWHSSLDALETEVYRTRRERRTHPITTEEESA